MLTTIVLTKNEENNIKDCLETLSFADEMIVVDDRSNDSTCSIAKRLGAKVYSRALENDFAAQRNFGLSKSKNDWVLFIDADERVTRELRNEILEAISNSCVQGYYLYRQDVFFGRELKYGETGKIRLIRIAKKEAGFWKRAVHETWQVKGDVKCLKTRLLHYPHPTIRSFLEKIGRYSTLHAKTLYEERVSASLPEIILLPGGKFILNYIFRGGFLDGMPGLIMAIMMSFHSFLARGKLYLLLASYSSRFHEND